MTLRIFALLATLSLATTLSSAQQTHPDEEPPPERLRAITQGPIVRLENIAQQITPELGLSDEQITQLDEILEGYRKQFSNPGFVAGLPRELAEEFRKAREAGDEARIKELTDRMRLMRGELPDSMLTEFFGKVEKILDDRQRPLLGPIAERHARIDNTDPADLRAAVDRLPETLGLSAEQRAEYDKLHTALNKEIDARAERARQNMELVREMHTAQDAGDQARAEEIMAKLRANRGPRTRPYEAFFDELTKVLTDAQRTKLTAFREEISNNRPTARFAPPDAERPLDLRSVLRAVQRIQVSREQQDKLDTILDAAREQYRSEAYRDPDARAKLTLETKKKVLEVLNDEQKARFEELLQNRRVPEAHSGQGAEKTPAAGKEPPKP